MKKRQLVTYSEADVAAKQHAEPCSDCPWARAALPGWLGELAPREWLHIAHGDGRVDCHTRKGKGGEHFECAGLAIYRANVAKSPKPDERGKRPLALPADRLAVFAHPAEFLAHHAGAPERSTATGLILCEQETRRELLEAARKAVRALSQAARHELIAELVSAEEKALAALLPAPPPVEPTIRSAILASLSGSRTPLESNDIYAILVRSMPGLNKGSFSSEVHKMLDTEPPLLVKHPGKGRVGRYTLAAGVLPANGARA